MAPVGKNNRLISLLSVGAPSYQSKFDRDTGKCKFSKRIGRVQGSEIWALTSLNFRGVNSMKMAGLKRLDWYLYEPSWNESERIVLCKES